MSKKGPISGTLFLLPSSIPVYMRLYPYTFEFIDIIPNRSFGRLLYSFCLFMSLYAMV